MFHNSALTFALLGLNYRVSWRPEYLAACTSDAAVRNIRQSRVGYNSERGDLSWRIRTKVANESHDDVPLYLSGMVSKYKRVNSAEGNRIAGRPLIGGTYALYY